MQIRHEPTGRSDRARIHIEGLERDLSILHLTDSHMAEGDDRDPEATEHVARFQALFMERTPGGEPAREVFRQTLATAGDLGVDGAVLTGDIIHFPAIAGLEQVAGGLDELGVPRLYTLGNHDWFYPHLEWSDETRQAYYPRFHELTGGNPACQSLDLGGVRLIALDNSTYQVSAEQVAFLRRELASGLPCLLFVHIPIWIESLAPAVMEMWKAPIVMGAAEGWTEETRVSWKVPGNDPSTLECHELLTGGDSANLAGIFCGHVHFDHFDEYRDGRCQYVTEPGFGGGYRVIELCRAG